MAGATVPTPSVLLAVSVEIACYCAQQQKAFLACKVCCMCCLVKAVWCGVALMYVQQRVLIQL